MRTTGTYVTTTTLGEAVRAFVPHPLPPVDPPLAPEDFSAGNHRAEMALARLAGVAGLVPSADWLLYSAIRKEALLTSQIEGTQATLTDLFDNEAGQMLANTADVEEVTNYLRAFRLVRDKLRSEAGLPISVRLLCDAHRLLLDGARGAGKEPGELRRSQNWIGGARPGRAVFVPPPPDHVPELLADLERFIHDPEPALPPLVRVALVHLQFETAHFSDHGHPFHADRGHRFTAMADRVQGMRVTGFIVSQVSAMAVKLPVLSMPARSAGVGNSAPKAMLSWRS